MAPLSIKRRGLLAAAGATLAAGHVTVGNARTLPAPPTENPATDAGYWDAVRGLYRVTPDIVNLENGYWGIMPEPVMETYIRHTQAVNFNSTLWTASSLRCAPSRPVRLGHRAS